MVGEYVPLLTPRAKSGFSAVFFVIIIFIRILKVMTKIGERLYFDFLDFILNGKKY